MSLKLTVSGLAYIHDPKKGTDENKTKHIYILSLSISKSNIFIPPNNVSFIRTVCEIDRI